MSSRKPRLSPSLIEEVRLLYAAGELQAKEISALYGKRANWVNQLASQHGWPLRTKAPRPATEAGSKVRRPGGTKPISEAEYRAQQAAKQADIARELYGDLLPDVEYLRRKFPIYRHGDLIMVGGRPRTEDEVREIAARERRLEQPDPPMLVGVEKADDEPPTPRCGCGRSAVHPGRCWFRRGKPGPTQGSGVAARVSALEAEIAALRERIVQMEGR